MKKIMNILIHDAPYKSPVIENLDELSDINFKNVVLYNTPTTHKEWDLENKKTYETFKIINIPLLGDFHFGVLKEIKKFGPDLIIISGYYPIINMIVILYCIKNNVNYIYGFDTVEKSRNAINNFINKCAMKNAEALFINGNKTKKFISNVLKDTPPLIQGFYCLNVDYEKKIYNNFFYDRKKNRKLLGISDNSFVFLFVGKLIENRRIVEFLNENMQKLDKDITLLIIGDGPQSQEVEQYSSMFEKRIIHIKQVSYSNLYKYYSIADGYFHPGKEPYSLALVQAIICKLPIVTSTDVGAACDFIVDSKNGYLVEKNDISKYSFYMNLIRNRNFDVNYIETEFLNVKKIFDCKKIAFRIKKIAEKDVIE